jgi:ATP-binding cassette, subfamily B, bacterial CvaB/MchF/RaxB
MTWPVLKAVTRKGIVVHDPAAGEKFYPLPEASKHLTGAALELASSESFIIQDERARLPLSAFLGQLSGSRHALIQILVLSIVLQLLILAAPLYLQLTVDEVIARGDVNLLIVLALGFGLLMMLKTATTAVRSLVLLVVQNVLQFQLGARLFRHLMRLPMSYFEKRHIGDLLSRFTSLQPIRNLLAEGMIAAVLDGFMAVITLAMIFVYSTQLALVVLAATVLYAGVRLALYRVLWQRTEATIQAQAQESSTFIESIRAIQSLKLLNRESEREGQWLNRYSEVVSTNVRLGRAKIVFTTLNDAIFGLENIITVYLAATLALSNTLTVGMIFALMSYKQHFIERAVQLIEKALDFRILGLHLERLADIALTPLERGHDQALAYTRQIRGHIELRNVSFRYADTEPFVLEDINITIEPGKFITIMGPSGGGKTTAYEDHARPARTNPGRGSDRRHSALRDRPAKLPGASRGGHAGGPAPVRLDRSQHLLFRPRVRSAEDDCLCPACERPPGDHGDDHDLQQPCRRYGQFTLGRAETARSASAGAVSRAAHPRLDEGTAHLDVDNERHINESLTQLRMTRVSVAHRPDISAGADRVIRIAKTVQSEARIPAALAISADHRVIAVPE